MFEAVKVFFHFLQLGCYSFGGPAAHIGYFRNKFVEELAWIDDKAFGQLIALSQFLPGPGSSQIGFTIGLKRAGLAGGVAAFLGFTLPSFLILLFVATQSSNYADSPFVLKLISGLKLLAVVVVADASISMFQRFCQGHREIVFCLLGLIASLFFHNLLGQLVLIVLAGIGGSVFLRASAETELAKGRLKLFPLLVFIGLFFVAWSSGALAELFSKFYQAGSFVFGGGHVVLPLLQSTVGDSITNDRFLFGYAAAQAIPGPMFSLSAFLGAELSSANPILGAIVACAAIFLPGFLLLLSVQDIWKSLFSHQAIASAAAGINAAVVGLLLAALYNPIFTSAVQSLLDLVLVLLGLFVLLKFKPKIIYLVICYGFIFPYVFSGDRGLAF